VAGEPSLPLAPQPAHKLRDDAAALFRGGRQRFVQIDAAGHLQGRQLAHLRGLLPLVALEFGDLASDR
jgi:hypothetical protein